MWVIFIISAFILLGPLVMFALKLTIGVYEICCFGLGIMILLIYELAKLTSSDSYNRADPRVDYPNEEQDDFPRAKKPMNDNLLNSNIGARPHPKVNIVVSYYNERYRQMKYEEIRQELLKKINKVRDICAEAKVDQTKAADIFRAYVEVKSDIETLIKEWQTTKNRRIGDKK